MKKQLTEAEIENKFLEINSREPEEPSVEDLIAISEAEAEGINEATSLSEFSKQLKDYSGKLVIRIPKSLHQELKQKADIEGVSLNQYMLYKLSK